MNEILTNLIHTRQALAASNSENARLFQENVQIRTAFDQLQVQITRQTQHIAILEERITNVIALADERILRSMEQTNNLTAQLAQLEAARQQQVMELEETHTKKEQKLYCRISYYKNKRCVQLNAEVKDLKGKLSAYSLDVAGEIIVNPFATLSKRQKERLLGFIEKRIFGNPPCVDQEIQRAALVIGLVKRG